MKKYIISIIIVAATLLVGCNHKDLCYHHPHTAKVRVDVDWSEFKQETPTGMTVIAYSSQDDKTVKALTNDIGRAYLNLEAGSYNTLSFNQSSSEFGSVEFRNLEICAEAEVISTSQSSRWYKTRNEIERVVFQPEWVATDFQEGAVVTDQMVKESMDHLANVPRSITEYVIANHTPKNIVYTLYAKINIDGIHNLRSARAALSGMSEGYRFASGLYKNTEVTHLMENWKMTQISADPTRGYINDKFYCFGLPDDHAALSDENILHLELLLVDNETILKFDIPVGDLIVEVDPENLILCLELDLGYTLPDVKPEGGAEGGFDVTVEDWGDEEEYDVPL